MIAAIDPSHPFALKRVWTADDLDTLPEDGRRYEVIDGELLVSAAPAPLHQRIVYRLCAALENSPCPEGYVVNQGVEIRISQRRACIPDVVVLTIEAAALNPPRFAPGDVILAVEVVSPGSKRIDRTRKPTVYAEAGIPHYWRIETDPSLTVSCFRLNPEAGMYFPVGMFHSVLDVAEPWPIKPPLDQLTSLSYR